MNVEKIVENLFEGIPYSKKYEKIKNRITDSLKEEYKKISKEKNKLECYGYLISNFGTLEKAGLLAGYKKEEINKWGTDENIINEKIFSRRLKKIKFFNIILSVILLYTIICIINASMGSIFHIHLLTLDILLLILFIYIDKKNIFKNPFSFEAFNLIKNETDKFNKRLLNVSIFIIGYISIMTCYYFGTKIRTQELLSYFLNNTFTDILFLYYCYIIFTKVWINKNIELSKQKFFKKELIKNIIFYFNYWLIISLLFILVNFKYNIDIKFLLFPILINLILMFYYNFTKRKNITYNNYVINKKRVIIVLCFCMVFIFYQVMKLDSWLLQPIINKVPTVQKNKNDISYNDKNGIYTIKTNNDNFKILQLTDIHIGGSNFSYNKDKKALAAVYKLINYTKPDLVVVTGDLVFPVGVGSMSLNNYTPIMQFASYMRNIGIPWAFVYGNHDTEALATNTEKDVEELFKSLSYKTTGTLLYPYIQPNIDGRNNQIIEIRNSNNKLLQDLFLMDSNSYYSSSFNSYDYIHDDEVEWYANNVKELSEQEGYTIPSMLFFHMPLKEYKDAYDLYKQRSNEVEYYYGTIGEEKEKINDSEIRSNLFSTALKLKSTTAMFCGHDHYNNISLGYKGIRLTFGLSIDYLAMPGIDTKTDQRGGTLITIDKDSNYKIDPIKLIDIK